MNTFQWIFVCNYFKAIYLVSGCGVLWVDGEEGDRLSITDQRGVCLRGQPD